MTREEALEFGNIWLELNEDCKDSITYGFFRTAIKALEQEPCEKEKEFAKFNDFYPEDRATYPPADKEILIKNHNGDNFIAYLEYDDGEDGGWGFYSENGDFIADVNEIDAWMLIPQHERDKNYIPVQERKANNLTLKNTYKNNNHKADDVNMADVELVIKIPKEMYDWLDTGFPDEDDAEKLWQVVKNGTPLPKGHGRLIDADKLISKFGNADGFGILERCFNEIETVIEADTQNISEKEDIELE